MGLFDSITSWIRKEKDDIGDALDDATESLDRDLTRKERELDATPEERIGMIQDQISDDPFSAIRDRIESTTAHAEAEANVDALDQAVMDEHTPGDSPVEAPVDAPVEAVADDEPDTGTEDDSDD